MKILELRFKNLNSLYGEWLIDFTHPDYVSNGIFALSGPTGAGKSTVLDAICLALYGATPRLGKITKSSNDIMSRQTCECFAEVVFESQEGRFRCKWAQRKARMKVDGKLQDQEHQIADAYTGVLIETKKSLVLGVIEQKTGMDFDRFTRSVLLAQGGFDTFLKADIEQKSKILEQITGTEIYSDISRRIHENLRQEREQLYVLQAQTSGLVSLDEEQEQTLRLDLQQKQQQEQALNSQVEQTGKAVAWLNTVAQLKKEITETNLATHKAQADYAALQPQREQLAKAQHAAHLEGEYATLEAQRSQHAEDQKAFRLQESLLPNVVRLAHEQAQALLGAEQATAKAKEAQQSQAPLIKQVRALDQTLQKDAETVSALEKRCTADVLKITQDQDLKQKEETKRHEVEQTLQGIETFLTHNAQDEWLIGGLGGVQEQLQTLATQQINIENKGKAHKQAQLALEQTSHALKETTQQNQACKQELEAASKNLEQAKQALLGLLGDRLLREYRAEKDVLNDKQKLLATIASLEQHRAALVHGQECPLCGSKEHPFAQGHAPVADEIDQKIDALSTLIAQAENLETTQQTLEKEQALAQSKVVDADKLQTNASHHHTSAEKALAQLQRELSELHSDFAQLKQTVAAKLKPLGIDNIPDEDASSLLESLKTRLNQWQSQVKHKQSSEVQIAALYSEIKRMAAVLEAQTLALNEKRQELEHLKSKHESTTQERQQLFGDKQTDEQEQLLHKAITEADGFEKQARARNTAQQEHLSTAQAQLASLKKRIHDREPQLKEAQVVWRKTLQGAGFADESQWQQARLTPVQREQLSIGLKRIDEQRLQLQAKLTDREAQLNVELEKQLSPHTLTELEPQLAAQKNELAALIDVRAGLVHKLKENALAKESIKEKQSAIDAQKKECQRWENLHALIGSADGKKYRNFAQGLTFELMVAHANRQLEKMTDRYLLTHDSKLPLELNVVDNYQAGEIRSSKNLSGGESFIVSLTLALGLSKMASRKVRVDSLFLDEGFGTLDEDALDTALETLSNLHEEGKLIGVISHVTALKERIPTQIHVNPDHGGRSVLVGAGCHFLPS